MKGVVHVAQYGSKSIDFTLERRRRSTLEITVEPDGRVQVVAPSSATLEEIGARVQKRGRWILLQQREFAKFLPRTPARRYIPGETHLYLGRQYRLRVEPGCEKQVRLLHGFIQIDGVEFDDSATIERLVKEWYRVRATVQFQRRLEIARGRFADPDLFKPTALRLQSMTSRWGSMTPAGRLLLNPELVRAPVDAIDYVITHELCHLAEPNHGRNFYELQNLVMPDWKNRKIKLERVLA